MLQEGAYKAILNVDKVKNPEYIDSWIVRIMINEALSILRERKKIFTGLDNIPEKSSVDEMKNLDLEMAISKIDPDDRKILLMKYMGDYTFDEISECMSLNINTVKSRVYRALTKLRDIMGDR